MPNAYTMFFLRLEHWWKDCIVNFGSSCVAIWETIKDCTREWIETWKYFERILPNHKLYWWRMSRYIHLFQSRVKGKLDSRPTNLLLPNYTWKDKRKRLRVLENFNANIDLQGSSLQRFKISIFLT